jgi:hypothetical protein
VSNQTKNETQNGSLHRAWAERLGRLSQWLRMWLIV